MAILLKMSQHVLIDGNNLLFAMRSHAPVPAVGRETLVRIVERWARRGDDEVTVVFDGPDPPRGLLQQMASRRIAVRFSAPQTADDIIVDMMERARRPDEIRVVTGDTAIKKVAAYRRCKHIEAVAFVRELFAPEKKPAPDVQAPDEKPSELSPEEAQEWADLFGVKDDEDEPFDGFNAMQQ